MASPAEAWLQSSECFKIGRLNCTVNRKDHLKVQPYGSACSAWYCTTSAFNTPLKRSTVVSFAVEQPGTSAVLKREAAHQAQHKVQEQQQRGTHHHPQLGVLRKRRAIRADTQVQVSGRRCQRCYRDC